MEHTVDEEEECGICLDELTNPVALPCSHKFCSNCLNGWRSKYGGVAPKPGEQNMEDRKCPLCREKIPPSKEMVAQLKYWRNAKSECEADGDIFCENYLIAKSKVEELERQVGDWTETIDCSDDDDDCVVLPTDIVEAATANDIGKILNWLGPLPVDKQRLNAKNPEFLDITLVHCAVIYNNSELLSILLQLGADVDSADAGGATPLAGATTLPDCYTQARLLLEWGAETSNCAIWSKDKFIERAHTKGNTELANLLKSEFGGRRCEIINLLKHPDLIGKTCVVEKYLADKGRYKVIFEVSKEVGHVGPENLIRRDRTPGDCGYYIMYENGRTTRHDFASKEECQVFVASLTEKEKSGDGDAAGEARAEEAEEALLAELKIDSSEDVKSETKGEQEGKRKKKGRK